MKRIESIVAGVTETVKKQYKEKRINAALKSARINAEEDLDVAKAELDMIGDKIESMSAEEIVNAISECMDAIEVAEANLDRVNKIEKFLNEEV